MAYFSRMFEAKDLDSLSRLDLRLHGATFHLGNVQHDADEQRLTVTFEHARTEELRARAVAPFVWRVQAPLRMWRITCRGVTAVSVDDQAEVGTYAFDDLSWRSGVLRIEATPALVVAVRCAILDVVVDGGADVVGRQSFVGLGVRRPGGTGRLRPGTSPSRAP